MNRERNSSGINSYEKEFKFKPEVYLESKIREFGQASWLDLCCGYGKALIQTAAFFYKLGRQNMIKLKGIDLVDTFPHVAKEITCVEFESGSVIDWVPEQTYDLITCVHGLHYPGDKLKVIETSIKALNPTGLFIANLDLNNIVIEGKNTNAYLKKYLNNTVLFITPGVRYLSKLEPRLSTLILNIQVLMMSMVQIIRGKTL